MRGISAVVLTCAVTAVLAGCSSAPEPGPTSPTTSSSSSSSSTTSSSSSTTRSSSSTWSTSEGPNDAEMTDAPSRASSPTWDAKAKKDAAGAAVEVLRAFARPDISQGEWWRDLGPLLSPSARTVYDSVDVRNVPIRKVTGKPRIIESSSPYLATVRIGTDRGPYTLLMVRAGQGEPWLAERIEPERST